jgi:hypothetical protein
VKIGNSNFRARAHWARPRPLPVGQPLGQFHERHAPWGYPAGRKTEGVLAGVVAERYYRFEATEAEVTLADTVGAVLTFSGYPDKIVLHARTGGALFTLTDRFNGEQSEVIVHADVPREVFLPRNVATARNLVAGTNAIVWVEGYYMAPIYGSDAR